MRRALIADPKVQIVIELIGGYDVPRKFILEAFAAGKHVVDGEQGAARAARARRSSPPRPRPGSTSPSRRRSGAGFRSCAPCEKGWRRTGSRRVLGILNGTTNYVLTEMESTGEDFDVVLKRAQALGYAEADPTFDVDGIDAAHKLALLTTMAFGAEMTFEDIPTEGIRGLLPIDFELAAEFGYRIKLLGVAKCHPRCEGGASAIEVARAARR